VNHEPECPYNDASLVPTRTFFGDVEVSVGCTFCGVIRAAYQRGREDAAKAVESVKDYHGGSGVLVNRNFAAAAARGDGEQA